MPINRCLMTIAGTLAMCSGLTACQQVFDRLQADLKEAKVTPVKSATPEVNDVSGAASQTHQARTPPPLAEATKGTPSTPKPKPPQVEPPGQKTVAKPSEPTPVSSPVGVTIRETPVLQTQQPKLTAPNNRTITNQVQTIDEDGNPLVESAGSKTTKSRVLIED